MIDLDELRSTVALKHNVLLGKDDPILVTVTMHELIMARYIQILTEAYAQHQKELTAAIAEQTVHAKEAGGRIITDAAEYASGRIREAVNAALADADAAARRESQDARLSADQATSRAQMADTARSTATMAAIAACAAAVLAIIAAALVMLK